MDRNEPDLVVCKPIDAKIPMHLVLERSVSETVENFTDLSHMDEIPRNVFNGMSR